VRLVGDPGISIAGGSKVYASGVYLRASPTEGIRCLTGGTLWLEDSRLGLATGAALTASACDIRIRRSQIIGNVGGGLELTNGSDLRLWSSIVGGNGDDAAGTVGVSLTDSSFDIRYATIANNTATTAPPGTLVCTGSSGTVRNSILLAEAQSVDCVGATFTGSYSDALLGGDNLRDPYDPALFADTTANDYHVKSSSTDLMGVARWELGDPRHDVDGTLRGGIPGGADWTGADVP
jgi:hypothetical protein